MQGKLYSKAVCRRAVLSVPFRFGVHRLDHRTGTWPLFADFRWTATGAAARVADGIGKPFLPLFFSVPYPLVSYLRKKAWEVPYRFPWNRALKERTPINWSYRPPKGRK